MKSRYTTRMFAAACALSGACAVALVIAAAARPAAADDRTERRAAEMPLPDPYLDPSWPDEAGEEMDGRYAPGHSDSVEEVPLDEELEMQEELRVLQEPTRETPPADQAAPPPGGAVAPPPAAADDADEGTEEAPVEPEPYVPQDDGKGPDLDQRDPVEW